MYDDHNSRGQSKRIEKTTHLGMHGYSERSCSSAFCTLTSYSKSYLNCRQIHEFKYKLDYATGLKGVENDASARRPNLTSASRDLDFHLLTPKLTISCPYSADHLCQFASKSVHLRFQNSVFTSLVTKERRHETNGRTDERTVRKHYTSGQTDKSTKQVRQQDAY